MNDEQKRTVVATFDLENDVVVRDEKEIARLTFIDRPRGEEGHCPRCGSWMYGRFEPLAKYGTELWCSNCGYTWPHSPIGEKFDVLIEDELPDSVIDELLLDSK